MFNWGWHMSISRNVAGSHEPASVLQFPFDRTRTGHADVEHVVSETYWMIVSTDADGARELTKMRSPRFLSPCRAYSLSEAARGVRSLLLYKFARQTATGSDHPALSRVIA